MFSKPCYYPLASTGLWRQRAHLRRFLPNLTSLPPGAGFNLGQWQGAVVGWGHKPSGLRAEALAAKLGMACWRLEDGFVRSLGLGHNSQAWSVVLDDLGIYYDATRPSRLEQLIAQPLSAQQQERAQALLDQWQVSGLSKYNHLPEYSGPLPESMVLVVDQTLGDQSVRMGLAGPESFTRMIEAALANHPRATLLLKVHPDVLAGRKQGYVDLARWSAHPRIRICAEACHPWRLLAAAEAVYCVTSQLGFEALMQGKPVYCFGMPFYAGWGLTHDALPPPMRRRSAGMWQLLHAALVAYPRYWHPQLNRACEVEELLPWLASQRQERLRYPRQFWALGFSLWKRIWLRRFFPGAQIHYCRHELQLPSGKPWLVWGSRQLRRADHGSLWRLEDGFIRSVGLGAGLVRPMSWVCDDRGLYYNSQQPSRLEHILADAQFDQSLLQRAQQLRQQLVAQAISKYNLPGKAWQRPEGVGPVILVPGQVESDASLAYGSPMIRSNLRLLQRVRAARPDAFIIYKPHPDVVAGLRKMGQGEEQAERLADLYLPKADISQLLQQVDEVHTLTSLTGFEALLRGKEVHCYGQPFYSNWGLTVDQCPLLRRKRTLTLDQLVAGAMLLYPSYLSLSTDQLCQAEDALQDLQHWRQQAQQYRLWTRALLALKQWLLSWRRF